jgi:hypothetical protein
MTPDEQERLDTEIFLAEEFGETNKTPDAIWKQMEADIIKRGRIATRRLETDPLPEDNTPLAIPKSVSSTLEEYITLGKLPITKELVEWMEIEVEKYNHLPDETVAMEVLCQTTGKMWKFNPDIAAIQTGFIYLS